MAASGNAEPEMTTGCNMNEDVNVTGAPGCTFDWIAPTVALIGNIVFLIWTRRVNDINPWVIPLMGNVILFALYINITVFVSYKMKISRAGVNAFLDMGLKIFTPVIILYVFLYVCYPGDDNFVESSTYKRRNVGNCNCNQN